MPTIAVELQLETERKLREKATLQGETLEAFIQRLAEREAQSMNGLASSPEGSPPTSVEVWSAQWRNWTAGHAKLPVVADDSRQTIYDDRGL